MPYNHAIGTLKDSPMFHLSLSSKELFHSNFLYWIWKIDPTAFQTIMRNLGAKNVTSWPANWEVLREYESFDLCVVEQGTKRVLLVLENKVKSIPYKAQLDKYEKKVQELYGVYKDFVDLQNGIYKTNGKLYQRNPNNPKSVEDKFDKYDQYKSVDFILLTLPSGFPDQGTIQQQGKWVIATYLQYLHTIKNLTIQQGYKKDILTDYCSFVGALLDVYDTWNNKCYQSNSPLLNTQYIADAEELRIHDLYHKSKYAQICAEIQSKIQSHIQGVAIIENDDKVIFSELSNPQNQSSKFIAFGYGYTNGQPFVDVKVAFRDGDHPIHHPIICIIQAQGGWYRHGIIMDHSKLSKYDGTKDQRIWNYLEKNNVTPIGGDIICVNGHKWMRFENFANDAVGKMNSLSNIKSVIDDNGRNIVDANDLYPNCKSRKDSQPYGKYAGDNSNIGMIYQYRKLASSVTVGKLIDYIVEDVKRLIR